MIIMIVENNNCDDDGDGKSLNTIQYYFIQ